MPARRARERTEVLSFRGPKPRTFDDINVPFHIHPGRSSGTGRVCLPAGQAGMHLAVQGCRQERNLRLFRRRRNCLRHNACGEIRLRRKHERGLPFFYLSLLPSWNTRVSYPMTFGPKRVKISSTFIAQPNVDMYTLFFNPLLSIMLRSHPFDIHLILR